MCVAVRYAVSREELERDPFKGIGKAVQIRNNAKKLSKNKSCEICLSPGK